jgi:hypothetical protein
MGSPHVRSNGAFGPRPQLPAFCRTRRPTTVAVTARSLASLRLLVLLGLVFQLSTLLLLLAGPMPPPLAPLSTSTVLPTDAGVATSGAQPIPPLSDQ